MKKTTPKPEAAIAQTDQLLDAFFSKPTAAEAAPAAPTAAQRCGMIAIVGKPNVGKSTLLNALVGQKVSITSRKAQTTRHRILGIRSQGAAQFVFADTPGFQTRHGTALNRSLNKTVTGAVSGVDLILLIVEAGRLSGADAKVLSLLGKQAKGVPVVLVANKLDTVNRRADIAPWLQEVHAKGMGAIKMEAEEASDSSEGEEVGEGEEIEAVKTIQFAEIIPMSAKQKKDIERLLVICEKYLPEQPWIYTQDEITDKSERFMAGEVVREKLFRFTGDELPYTSTVVIDQFKEEPGKTASRFVKIAATIIVERDSHKAMVIGSGGEGLKRMGTEAREELERLMDAKVFLQLWVKVQGGWADNAERVKSFGYE
ncbi:MAG: GTPase Era [Burkholderiales bacterium]|nr:MAG: GTPase Era [Burkholderiales bacterium]